MAEPVAGILICGTSHTGKTTLAARIGQAAGCRVIATDDLARHPGRPWPEVRAEVAEYYASLSAETIHWFLKVHRDNMQCQVHHAIEAARARREVFVIEGAALRPELYAPLIGPTVIGVCLYVEPDMLRARILQASDHARRDPMHRQLIDAFVERSLRDNAALNAAAISNGFDRVDAHDSSDVARLAERLIRRLKPAG